MRRRSAPGPLSLFAPLAFAATAGCGASAASDGLSAPDASDVVEVATDASAPAPDAASGLDASAAADADAGSSGDSSASSDGGASSDSGSSSDQESAAFETHCPAAGSVYYVAPTGSDDAATAGTPSAPWASVAYAAKHVAPGDTVRIAGGTYRPTSTQLITSSGTSSSWICFEAAPGATPVWDGTKIEGDDVFKISGQYIALLGQEVTSSTLHGIEVVNAHSVDLVDDVVHDSAWAAITIGPSGADMTSTTDVRVHGCEVYENGLQGTAATGKSSTTSTWPAILRSFGAANVSFTANVVHDNYGEGVDFILTDTGEATDNVVYDNYSVNMYLDNASHITLARNLVYWSNTSSKLLRNGNPPAGIQMAEEKDDYPASNKLVGNVIVDNIVIGCSTGINYASYQLNLGMASCTFAGNTVYAGSRGGDTLSIADSSGHTDNTVVDNIFFGGALSAPTESSEFTYSHNLFFDASHSSSLAGAGDVLADPGFADAGAFTAAAYRVGAASPAHGAGVATSVLTEDFGGDSRASKPTLGAWEAQ